MDLEEIEDFNLEGVEEEGGGNEPHDNGEMNMVEGGEGDTPDEGSDPEPDGEGEGERFDITLPASHSVLLAENYYFFNLLETVRHLTIRLPEGTHVQSTRAEGGACYSWIDEITSHYTNNKKRKFYMGPELNCMGGRVVLEAGWAGRVPALAHHGVLFPGETVPMLVNNRHDTDIVAHILSKDKLFGLLCPDETCTVLSGYGVVCEVFEAALSWDGEQEGGGERGAPASVSFKARAIYRFKLKDMPKRVLPLALYVRMRYLEVVVLPEQRGAHALRHARLAALDSHRALHATNSLSRRVRRLDAALTPWPWFVYEMFDFGRMRCTLYEHFASLGTGLEKLLPHEPVALSFWVASNLALGARDRLALFTLDSALLRLHLECKLIDKKSVLCCATCGVAIARREHAVAMSTDGAHSNYTNPGGFVHDILTVSRARNTRAAAAPSAEFSWFPGYLWSVAVCACCDHHVGWRFDAASPALRPRRFYALCRNYLVPRDAERLPSDTPPL